MPPFIPHKRHLSPTPPLCTPPVKSTKKSSLFDTIDTSIRSASLQENKAFLDHLEGSGEESSLSDLDSGDFEDALPPALPKRRKLTHHDGTGEDNEDEVAWEEAIQADRLASLVSAAGPCRDLELILCKDADISSVTASHDDRKSPSKIERQIRISTHRMHVQFLLFHNLIRSGWACDGEVQKILKDHLPPGVETEIKKWRIATGLQPERAGGKPSLLKGRKGTRNQRDWGRPAEKQEIGVANMSHGDPLVRLLKVLATYWKKTFTITAPSLRKQGYKSLATLEEELSSYKDREHDPEHHGERVQDIKAFRQLARACEGSRDIGNQLFTALLRGLGLECRLVASLQPIGFGWNKNEEATEKKYPAKTENETKMSGRDREGDAITVKSNEALPTPIKSAKQYLRRKLESPDSGGLKIQSNGARGVYIDSSESSNDDCADTVDDNDNDNDDDDSSVVDITPSTPRKQPCMKYDRDMSFPTYWTEVISPITNEVYPVDPFVLNPALGTKTDHLALYEAKGKKAEQAKQVFAYVVAYADDGTAKDVTTRYLRRHMWPGSTKGVRLPTERIPIYNEKGKIRGHEAYDWFKSVMRCYTRSDNARTAVDDLEDSKDLRATKPEKKEPKTGEDTLQALKSSAKFVLERHLRREEALKPGTLPVRKFLTGKGDKAKEEPVYKREDVEVCRTGESWHKEGRAIKGGEIPRKMVPIRAVTLTRKREVEEAEKDSGEKLKQGLYALEQTDWIIPPPIESGIIPKNAFGNIDCFVPTMIPQGAVHIPLRSTMKICKRLGIDFAEAVTGFEFGNKRAVPVITGVVVAKENEHAIIDEWKKDEEERRIKEEGRREKTALATWRKWLLCLRIVQRVREEYSQDQDADFKETMNPFTNPKARRLLQDEGQLGPVQNEGAAGGPKINIRNGYLADDEFLGGGFLLDGCDEAEPPQMHSNLAIVDGQMPLPRKSVTPPKARAPAVLANDGIQRVVDRSRKEKESEISACWSEEAAKNKTMSETASSKPEKVRASRKGRQKDRVLLD